MFKKLLDKIWFRPAKISLENMIVFYNNFHVLVAKFAGASMAIALAMAIVGIIVKDLKTIGFAYFILQISFFIILTGLLQGNLLLRFLKDYVASSEKRKKASTLLQERSKILHEYCVLLDDVIAKYRSLLQKVVEADAAAKEDLRVIEEKLSKLWEQRKTLNAALEKNIAETAVVLGKKPEPETEQFPESVAEILGRLFSDQKGLFELFMFLNESEKKDKPN